ncbi:hypothetical protein VL20_3719 [Microcystis panniformis FACHB-1757]|uniref:Uncharacterized protein n=1 Tax=Microcystis panniformis FACHB-1757 TaxID=1638788 RepID=A0A0K1S3S6_9CHRO|nr:hypothetical protein VL20_3719 [Microcystis panniformis FACHB-1757]
MNHGSLLIKIGGTGQSYFTLRQVGFKAAILNLPCSKACGG